MLAFTEYMPKALRSMFQIVFPSMYLWLYVFSPVCFPLIIGAAAITQELTVYSSRSARGLQDPEGSRPWQFIWQSYPHL